MSRRGNGKLIISYRFTFYRVEDLFSETGLASLINEEQDVEFESIRKMLARAADMGHSNQHNAQGSTSF